MIKQHLKQLGLTDTEVEVYLTTYEYGRLSAGSLARLTGIKRPTVYAAADELAKRGMVLIDESSKQRIYHIKDAGSSLGAYLTQQENQMESVKQATSAALAELHDIPRSSVVPTPKVRVVAGKDIEEFLYQQTPVWEESMKNTRETTWWGFQDETFIEYPSYQEWILWYWKRAPRAFKLKLLTNDSEVEKEMKTKKLPRRETRAMGGDCNLTAGQWVLGEYIISVTTANKPHYLTQIHDPVLAHNLRELYKNLWKQYGEK